MPNDENDNKDLFPVNKTLYKELRSEICDSSEELHDWIKTYLDIDLPDCTVSEFSNSNPMHMIWWNYYNAIHSDHKHLKEALFIANRSGYKTLGASIVELLMVYHAKRDVVHLGAIAAQAKRCYQYFQNYFRQNDFRDILWADEKGRIKDPVMEKTILKDNVSLEILPCTLAAVNGPHTPYVCIGGGTYILIDNTNRIVSENRDRVQITMKKLVDLVQSGKNINAISYNLKSKQIESKPIIKAEKTGSRERLKIEFGSSKRNTLWCTEDHLLWSIKDNKYKPASEFIVGDKLLSTVCEKEIINITKLKIKRDVFDITVKDNNNFFAGSVLVHNCLDEVDTVQDMAAYNDINGIPTKTKDGRPPVKAQISTRKTAAGLVARTAEDAKKTGIEVFSWNIIDLTKRCPDERSLTKEINIYTNLDTLEAISEEELKKRPIAEQKKFEKRSGLEGCLKNCKMFAACLGNLKNQKSTSNILHDIEYVENELFSKPTDWVNAQLLCRKPSMEGIIYSRYSASEHVKTYQQMYEIFMGHPWQHDRVCSFDDLREEFEKSGIRPVMGVDFGDHLAVLLLIYIDGKDRVYVVKEQTFTATDDAELAEWARVNWAQYDVDMIYADPASPSGIRLLRKAGFVCHDKVDKDVWGGIGTVRRFLRIPGTNRIGMMISNTCTNLIEEMPRYHKKYNKSLNMIMEDPVKKNDHSLDALRYPLHTKFGQNQANLGYAGSKEKEVPFDPKKPIRSPDAQEFASLIGVDGFSDDRGDFIRDQKTGRMRRKKDSEYGDGNDDDDFSF